MKFSIKLHTIKSGGSIVYKLRGHHRLLFPKIIIPLQTVFEGVYHFHVVSAACVPDSFRKALFP